MTIATGQICRGNDTFESLALMAGFRDKVRVICGDGTGDFSSMGEEPVSDFAGILDYEWDFNSGGPEIGEISGLRFWPGSKNLYALRNNCISLLRPSLSFFASGVGEQQVCPEGGGDFFDMVVLRTTPEDLFATWDRIAFVGEPGLGATW